MPRPLTRRFAVLLSAALLLGAGAAAAAVERQPGAAHAFRLAADANAPLRANRLAQVPITFRGGPITTSTGETVDVRVSDALPVETSTPEAWAEFLTKLTHGPEIASLTTYIVSFDEVQQICGSRALGCYGRDEMVAPGEVAADITAEEIVRHEYGHHIAANRSNAPWTAVEWGPKRWASAANVCARVSRREAYPGDQGSNYARNPGEAWAEAYRLMDERKVGITTATWQIVAPSFFPNDVALQAAELDVVQPWTAQRTTVSTRVFGRRTRRRSGGSRSRRSSTAICGSARRCRTAGRTRSRSFAPIGARVIARAQWTGQRVKRLDGSICGQRSLFVRVTQRGALGRVRVSVTTP